VSRHVLADDAATADLGRRIAAVLRPGDLVALVGDLGAGKTAIARTIVRTLVGDERLEVPSPTFALVQPYDGVIHADLYRIRDPREVDELGLFDRPEAIVLVEWPERAPELLAEANVRIALSIPADGRGRVAEVSFADGRHV
jgi:tRNA threonylcarbamoyl adenosine modification protein YjeE